MKLEFSRNIFQKKYLNFKFHYNPSSGSRVVPCGRTGMTKFIVDMLKSVNMPNEINQCYSILHWVASYNIHSLWTGVFLHYITSRYSVAYWLLHFVMYSPFLKRARGYAVVQLVQATSWEVAGSIPDGVTAIFHWLNPSGPIMDLGLTQSLTEMSTMNISWGVKAAGA